MLVWKLQGCKKNAVQLMMNAYVLTVSCAFFFFLSADDPFETVNDRELRQIFEGQNRIHLEIKQLNRQLDMILDEQRRYVSAVTDEIAKRGAGVPGQQVQVTQKVNCS